MVLEKLKRKGLSSLNFRAMMTHFPCVLQVVDQRLGSLQLSAIISTNFNDVSLSAISGQGGTGTSMLSFLRKISIGGKIRDGLPTVNEMEATEGYPHTKNKVPISRSNTELKESVYDLLRTIKDPEKPQTLEQLDVVYEDCIEICKQTPKGISVIRIEFNPTVPHCSLATLIGLCIRVKLERHLVALFKLDIFIKKGAHSTEQEINKQINDKERIAAAMENPNLRELVEKCIQEEE